ncbi:L-idonate 5-dehydrogenase [Glutamicibacter sp. NPDC087344]|uniref:L-idonate 5-dehydrogenase n=1 Tax=Glutamicibacter sp. NPDC087344 TaxID=3363994 RepID=UPI0038302BFE
MKAVVVRGAMDLRIEQTPVATAGAGQVLVAISYGGICGSDLHYWQYGANGSFQVREPLVLGHEVVGRVAQLGPEVSGFALGDPVAIHPASPCPLPGAAPSGLHLAAGGSYLGSASTTPHTQGGLTGNLVVQVEQLRALPAELELRTAALAEPLAIALHGVGRLGDAVKGARCFVSGAGPIGLLAAAVLRFRGAAHVAISDLQPRALEVAGALGADELINIAEGQAPSDAGFDIGIEAAGAPRSLQTVLGAVRRAGSVVQLGILPRDPSPVGLAELGLRELTVYGSQRFETELDEAIELLAAHPELEQVISHVFELEDAVSAFEMAADSAKSSKVLIHLAD